MKQWINLSSPGLALGLALCGFAGAGALSAQGGAYDEETPEQRDARMKWWREARFGLFIHWGLYSVPAGTYQGERYEGNLGEHIMRGMKVPVKEYEKFAAQFNPVKFDADEWVRMAQDAGMKYMVITAKHHDGFAMYHTNVNKWNIVDATPFGRDPIRELADACKKHGMKLGFYYSQAQDWRQPGGYAPDLRWDPAQEGDWNDYVRTVAVPQAREILSNYGPVCELWWDSARHAQTVEGCAMIRECVRLQPDIIVNSRLGKGFKGDFNTPEQWVPATGQESDWETCMTMNATWGYRSDDPNWKSPEDLLRKLVDIASKGGNFLLNVGPKADGTFPQESVERLRFIGDWMKANGESIHATTSGPFPRLEWGRATAKRRDDGATLYLHVFDWPSGGVLRVPGLRNPVKSARLLAAGQAVQTAREGDDVDVRVPADAPHPVVSVVALELEGALDVDTRWPTHGANGAITLTPDWAAIHNSAQRHPQARLVGKGADARIENWVYGKVRLEWPLAVEKLGSYEAELEAEPNEGVNVLQVRVDGGVKLKSVALESGGAKGLQRLPLGRIEFDQPGLHTLELRPAGEEDWTGVRVASLRLTPVAREFAQ